MMQVKILKLHPNSRFHFGRANVITRLKDENTNEHYFDASASLTDTDTFLRSDVLFAALANNLAQVKSKKNVDKFVKAFDKGEIKVSSAFYCVERVKDATENFTYLLPRPVSAPNYIDIEHYDLIKQIKKVQFICPETLNQYPKAWKLMGNVGVSSGNRDKIDPESNEEPKRKFLYDKEEEDKKEKFKLYTKGVATHVGIHRPNEKAFGPYSVSYVQIPDYRHFDLKVHYYFLYEVSDAYRDLFELAVELLKYNGVGGERSSGYGQIADIEDKNTDFESKLETGSSPRISLSMIIPEKDEINQLLYYQYSIRGGRMTPQGRLKSVPMLHEGAILQHPVQGKLVSLSTEGNNPNVRNGKSFSIPASPIFSTIRTSEQQS